MIKCCVTQRGETVLNWVEKYEKLGVKLRRSGVSMPHRFVCGEKLSDAGVSLVRAEHALWKVFKMHSEGLSPKERELLEQYSDEITAIRQKVHKIQFRAQHSCGKWWED